MSRRSRYTNGPNKPLALFATILVVVGVAAVVYVSSKTANEAKEASGGSSTSTVPTGPADSRKLLLVNENGVTIQQIDGHSERLNFDQFKTRYKDAVLPMFGTTAASGLPVQFFLPESPSSTAPTGMSPDGRYVAHLGTAQSDGASVINITEGKEAPRKIVLRQDQRPLTDAFMYGWFDAKTLMVIAKATSTRWVYGVGIDGNAKQLVSVPDNVVLLQGLPGALWYVSATKGEGIESPPKAPSSLHRVMLDGTDMMVFEDKDHVIVSLLPGPDGVVAYLDDSAEATRFIVGHADSFYGMGKVRPLLFLADGSLIVRNGFKLEIQDFKKEKTNSRVIGTLPEGAVSVFYFDESLDRAP